ncbi:MmgE/PrpD family protein [Tepidiphilus sp. B18-69]|uniref:MmgE/PrpD family protein n=2 Tax=Tepidiphilus baoligensis TaxID=2698687 RepID=A0ABX1QM14_9PROT|nr:MmgE/PrpD family protein [Tepidiphilus baoligensis]
MPIAQTFARFANQLRDGDIPQSVRERARYLILDAVGIALASTQYEFAHRTLSAASEFGDGDSDVIGFGVRLALRDAVLINGLLVHGLDYDDTHTRGVIHATASCFPCALGVAAASKLSGRELVTSYVIGVEVAARLGSVAKGGFHQTGFHPTGLIGTFACTLIAGRLRGLNERQLAMAQGIALSLASGSLEFLQDGAWTKRIHPGWAGAAGITAAALARNGFIGPKAVYEGRFGLFNSHLGALAEQCDYSLATEGLGETWEVSAVAVKPLPACHFTHACADSAIFLHHEHDFDPRDIVAVRALVPAEVIKTVCEPLANKRKPQNSYDAQFSIPYAVASGLVRGRFGLAELEPESIADPIVLEVANKVAYEADPASAFPKYYSGEVVVTLRDGRELRHREHVNRGASDRPLSASDIISKYLENASMAVSEARAKQILETVLALDDIKANEFSRNLGGRV